MNLITKFKSISLVLFLIAILFNYSGTYAQSSKKAKLIEQAQKSLENYNNYFRDWSHLGQFQIDSIIINNSFNYINIYFNSTVGYIPIREHYLDSLTNVVKQDLGNKFKKYSINIYSAKHKLGDLIPNIYRSSLQVDYNRIPKAKKNNQPLIRNNEKPLYEKGLQNNHIALWHSHGWYYEAKYDRWEWQRARLFGTVEDIGPMAFVIPYLTKMLENSGAVTLIPRERDTQSNEIIVDNDFSTGKSDLIIKNGKHKWKTILDKGFALKDTLFEGENLFAKGSALSINTSKNDDAKISYIPEIPEDGEYAVYISWANVLDNVNDAQYSIYHTGGVTRFTVNQTMGGDTWTYLGKFKFVKGKNSNTGKVELSNKSKTKGVVTTDAVKFGGGIGNIARRPGSEYISQQWSLAGAKNPALKNDDNEIKKIDYTWKLSGKKRYLEAARYYLQYAGIPFSVYSLTEGKSDYNDDYQSRGEWVNYLLGQHQPNSTDSTLIGLNIPVDLSFAFHTDAGVTPSDSIIGTLGIYSTDRESTIFPSGFSKMSSRDLTDIIQTQIIDDIRAQFNPNWTRRGLWDKPYSEAWRAKVPTMLLELLSHQNLADMRFSWDPRFRFVVSRAIYKGILKFQAMQEQREYVVQPLNPDNFSVTILDKKQVKLEWKPVIDSLEPKAIAKQYRVYQRINNDGFDNGTLTNNEFYITDLSQKGAIYSFYVTAVNEGGESFPTQILSVCLKDNNKKPVLIVNSFDRISAPKVIDTPNMSGIAWWDDMGVPHISEIAYAGNQYEYKRENNWLDDDSPGWGASYADMEGKVIPGNTFDFTYNHGKAIADAGYSFTSISREVFEKNKINPKDYFALDVIFGEQRSTPDLFNPKKQLFTVFTPKMINALNSFINSKTNILLSGAYVGSDMIELNDSTAIEFAKNKLHYFWRTNHADNNGMLKLTDIAGSISKFPNELTFNTKYNSEIYIVEAPDAIEPHGNEAITLLRYAGNNTSAGVLYNGDYKSIVLGFPFETIIDANERFELMSSILKFFEKNIDKNK